MRLSIRNVLWLGRRQGFTLIVLTVVLAAVMTGDAFLLRVLIDNVQSANWARFLPLVLIIICYLVVQAILYFGRQSYTELYANSALSALRSKLFGRIATGNISHVTNTSPDVYFSTFTAQCDQVKGDVIDSALWMFYLAMQLLFSIAAVLLINPILGACALVLCVPMALAPIVAKRPVELARHSTAAAMDALHAATGDLLHGIVDWRVYQRSAYATSRFTGLGAAWEHAANHEAKVQTGVDTGTSSFADILHYGVWIIGGLLIMHGRMSVADIVAFSSLAGNISVPLFQMSGLIAQLRAGRETLHRIDETIPSSSGGGNNPASLNTTERIASTPAHSISIPDRPLRPSFSTIEYKHVVLHSEAKSNNDVFVGSAHGINVKLNGTSRYLVVGPSGAGKSSLFRALLRLDSDWTGQITLDGDNLGAIAPEQIWARIGYLSQSSHLFDDSIRENIRLYDPSMKDDDILNACDLAEIGDWVRSRGLDSTVSNDSRALSGGERQRLLLARLLARRYRFCILDELSTGLDNDTAGHLEHTIARTIPGFISISHRITPQVLSMVDTVIIVANQEIMDIGSPEQVHASIEKLNLIIEH